MYGGLELKEGLPVYDRAAGLVGRVESWRGNLVTLYRPSGMTWDTRHISLRPVTEYESRQLTALRDFARRANRVQA